MLNEYKEYYDYTRDLKLRVDFERVINKNTNIYGRLMYDSIIKRYGLKRALTIIARRFLYHSKNNINTVELLTSETISKKVETAEKALNNWCSYKIVKNPELDELIGNDKYGKYYSYMLDSQRIYKKAIIDYPKYKKNFKNKTKNIFEVKYDAITKSIKYWENKYLDKKLKKNFYSSNTNVKSKFDHKFMSFDLIIADAIQAGPLENIEVYVPVNYIKQIKELHNVKYSPFISDFIFISALYFSLITKYHTKSYQQFNSFEISNWLHKRVFKHKFKAYLSELNMIGIYGEDIISNVSKKIFLESEYLSEFCTDISLDKANKFIKVSDDISKFRIYKEIKAIYTDA